MIVVLMGVCGSGKTTIGRALAASLGWPFHDADDFHPPTNVEKMAAGIALDDADRWPWLDRIVDELAYAGADRGHVVLACSALRQKYRDRLAHAGNVRFVYLKGDATTIAAMPTKNLAVIRPRLSGLDRFKARRQDTGSCPW